MSESNSIAFVDAAAISLIHVPPSLARSDLERRLPLRQTKDRTGTQCGSLKVIGFVGFIGAHSAWLCRCDCGCDIVVRATHLIPGSSFLGCGCDQGGKTHGMTHHTLYFTWLAMIHRCYRQDDIGFVYYGARGICVCDRWRYSIENFISDMGPKPSGSHTLDRRNNDGNYEPSNCRWATIVEQNMNRRAHGTAKK